MSGNSTSPSKLIPIAARPTKTTTVSTLKELSSSSNILSKNVSSINNPINNQSIGSVTTSTTIIGNRKIAPKPDDVTKQNSAQISKVAPKTTQKVTNSNYNSPQSMQSISTTSATCSLQKLREVVDSAAEQRQTATGQTVVRPVAPVPIAPRPSNSTTNLGQTPSNTGATPGTTPQTLTANKKQILPKPSEKKTIQQMPSSQPVVGQFNGNLISVFPNSSYRMQTTGQNQQIPQQLGIQMANSNFRLQFNSVSQQQALHQLQMNYLLQQQQVQQHVQQQKSVPQEIQVQNRNASIFPMGQQLLQPQLSISSNNGGTMYMISNPQIARSQLQTHFMPQFQQQQLRLSNPTMSMPSNTVFAKPTLVSQSTTKCNPIIFRSQLVVPTLPSGTSSNQEKIVTMKDSKKTGNASDDDENEPPPLLDKDETIATNVNEIFLQEAVAERQTRISDPVKHVVDDFVIEESGEPFELDKCKLSPLEILKRAQNEDSENTPKKKKTIKVEHLPSPSKVELTNVSGVTKGRRSKDSEAKKSLTDKPTDSPILSERPLSSKQNRELAKLLQMDFGPGKTPFKTTSPQEYAKEIQKQQTALRPVNVLKYNEDDVSEVLLGATDTCQGCSKTFAELGRRYNKYPQYCSKECRKQFKLSRKTKKRSNDSVDSLNLSLNDSQDSSNPKKSKLSLSNEEILETPDIREQTSHSSLVAQDSVNSIPSPLPSIIHSLPSSSNTGADYSKTLEHINLNPKNVNDWGPEEVERFINYITNSTANGAAFLREEIDGGSLLILNDTHLQMLGLKMGPSLKIGKAVEWLKKQNNL